MTPTFEQLHVFTQEEENEYYGRENMSLSDDEIDDIKAEMAAERAWRRRQRRYDCSDGLCGGDDCHRCRGENARNMEEEQENQE
jgi:hypothetical protein